MSDTEIKRTKQARRTTSGAMDSASEYWEWRRQQVCPRCSGGVISCPECHGVSRVTRKPERKDPK